MQSLEMAIIGEEAVSLLRDKWREGWSEGGRISLWTGQRPASGSSHVFPPSLPPSLLPSLPRSLPPNIPRGHRGIHPVEVIELSPWDAVHNAFIGPTLGGREGGR